MDIKEATVQFVKDLYASEKGLLPFTLYKRYGISPRDLVIIVKDLQAKGYLLLCDDNRILLTQLGRENAEGIIANNERRGTVSIDSAYFAHIRTGALDMKKPFIPSIQFFEHYKKEGEENG